MLKWALFPLLIVTPAFADQREPPITPGDVASFAVQELNKAYAIGAQALSSCQQSAVDLRKEVEELKAELKKTKDGK